MDQRLSFVTLAVRDLDASRAFYVDGLGWDGGDGRARRGADDPGWGSTSCSRSGWTPSSRPRSVRSPRQGVAPIALAHNVATREEVDAVLATARAAGADPVHEAFAREWGGYSGYFGDPDGYRWEIAFNPGPIGQVVLP